MAYDGSASGVVSRVAESTGSSLPEYASRRTLEQKLGPNALYTIEKKYLQRDDRGRVTETPEERIYTMAKTMADVELSYGKTPEQVADITRLFYEIIASKEFSPGGRIWSNAGSEIKALFNCYVLPVPDNIEGIFESVKKGAIIHKNGGGTGYNFSNLRPRGTYVQRSRGVASGTVSFIRQFDRETETINSGNRRGANMGIVNVDHPDILDFIYAKAERKEITNFNVSIGATNSFMDAIIGQNFYTLSFNGKPFTATELLDIVRNIEANKLGGSDVGENPKPASLRIDPQGIKAVERQTLDGVVKDQTVLPNTNVIDSYSGKVVGRVNEQGHIQLYAPSVMDTIAELAWKTGDPGMIFLDTVNANNPLPLIGRIDATNPCGEQPLHPYDACNLGSINLAEFITQDGKIDYNRLRDVVKVATRFMDNVNDANQGPIPEIEETVKKHRRIGMGVMGWADMLAMLKVPYDSEEAYALGERVMGIITDTAKETSVELAKEKGVFPAFPGSKYDNGRLEDRVRNVERTTIAPTGTISMLYDVASGIEPFFAIAWNKNIRGGDTLKYTLTRFEEECKTRGIDLDKLYPLIEKNHGSIQGLKEVPEDLQRVFKTSHDISSEAHIKMQAAFQRRTDNAVSKTINMSSSATSADVRKAYVIAYQSGCKGITVYRDGSKEVQVLQTATSKLGVEGNGTSRFVIEDIPDLMPSFKMRQKTPFGNMHMTFVYEPKTMRLKEVFAQLGHGGRIETADLEAVSRLGSVILRAGGGEEYLVDQLQGIGSNVSTPSRDGQIRSLPQAYAIGIKKFVYARESGMLEKILRGEADPQEVSTILSDRIRTGNNKGNGVGEIISKEEVYEVKCPECGGRLKFEEGCEKCVDPVCGYSKC